ncbi:hypothetical protein QBC35DRAFT_386932 [Podospora australis]|uniref:Pre-rRNA processing protein n=1 Tax=Podospora australis TaxID=1536484 RepID=A0AAN6WUN7_9PEZI|nr:hypothetical protein QBC35DRAFT_386932 [Podospora australis]
MADSETTPFLSAAAGSSGKAPDVQATDEPLETTPLLANSSGAPRYDDGDEDEARQNDTASISSRASHNAPRPARKKSSRWPSVIAMMVLSLFAVAIMFLAFFLPVAIEEYAKQAVVIEPTNLSLVSMTANGIRARIQANFRLDGQRVDNGHVRRVGKATSWLFRTLASEETKVSVYLPELDNVLLGTAAFPPLSVSIVEGQNNEVDFVADLIPGDAAGIRMIANRWLEGKLDTVRVQGKADVQVKAGVIPLGTHSIVESLTLEGDKLPQIPEYNITKINFEEKPMDDDGRKAMAAEVTIKTFNDYPVSVEVPELGFEILVPGCGPSDPSIQVATAKTSPIGVRSHSEVVVEAHGLVKELTKPLTSVCPGSDSSPLDLLMKKYLGNETATVFVRGQQHPAGDTPEWLADILSSITVAVPFPGRSFDNLLREFSLTDVHFKMPDPYADPDEPESNPRVSGSILVLAGLPSEMNFSLNVTDVRARANVFYKRQQLGELNLEEWQKANSTQIPATDKHEAGLKIQSRIEDAPLNVTDADVLTDVIQALLFGGKSVVLDIDALVDIRVQTILGDIIIRDVPAEGKIPVKPLGKGLLGSTEPQVGSIDILSTTTDSISLRALVNLTNPTPYSAYVPFLRIRFENNGTTLGEASAKDLDIQQGNNTDLVVFATWKPTMGGAEGVQRGRNLISEYLSGYNTTITIRTHRDSIPTQPLLGEALSRLNFTMAAPKLRFPDKKKDQDTHFIRDATFHLWSSTASFTLVNPLKHHTLYLDYVNATALYNHTEPIGTIEYDLPFAAPPGDSVTPRLPVDWSMDSVGYGKLTEALGGRMKLDAKAIVGVRLGKWTERLWYIGHGIGANVRL